MTGKGFVSGQGRAAPDGGKESLREAPYRTWWVFYIDPEKNDHQWRTAGTIGGRFTAAEAIRETVGRRFTTPFWAFALDKGDNGSFYDLHYPKDTASPYERRIGPAGYVAEVE